VRRHYDDIRFDLSRSIEDCLYRRLLYDTAGGRDASCFRRPDASVNDSLRGFDCRRVLVYRIEHHGCGIAEERIRINGAHKVHIGVRGDVRRRRIRDPYGRRD
jgi:hypothetical protein